ncbi:hypothetical protein [Bacillus coahuilensis]|uniref:hypothetical protein n=1 Tax=Bacillus coahuilensis TaxID=408580 RepID=UPI0001850711|nr:hypothetical protein [Bacillus coahuilensis]
MRYTRMFDMENLQAIRKKADEISYMCLSNHTDQDIERLKSALDHVSRALSMFAELEIQRMMDGSISYDPESYIKGRVRLAHKAVIVPQNDSFPA